MPSAAEARFSHIFFDVGGVLGTDGWDRRQRAAAVERFGLDAEEYAKRHEDAVGALEIGRMTLDEYLDVTIFDVPRDFTRDEFRDYMLAQSRPFPETIAVARALAAQHRWRMMVLNNESAELNVHRICTFGLRDIFAAFFSSCWLGVPKPARSIYERTLTICQVEPERALFIDDREQNLVPARTLGMNTIHYTGADQLATELAALGITYHGGKTN